MNEKNKDMYEEIAEGERWLSSFNTPGAGPQTVQKIKDAIGAELNKLQSPAVGRYWRVASGVWAAAAVIALSVTTVWYSSLIEQRSSSKDGLLAQNDAIIAVPPVVNESLAELEDWTDEQTTDLNGTSLYDALENVLADTGSTDVRG